MDWNTWEPYVMNVVGLAIAIAMIVAFRNRKRAQETWRSFALRHGFEHLPPGPPSLFSERAAVAFRDPGEVQGKFHDLPFLLQVAIEGTGKNRSVLTIMSVEIQDCPAGLTIYHENVFLKITKLFGARDVKTGDAEFDKAFVVKGSEPADVSAWLTQPRRSAILRVIGQKPDIDIRDGCLRFEGRQIVDDIEELEQALATFEALIPHVRSR